MPALNMRANLRDAIDAVEAGVSPCCSGYELILIDGGSTYGTGRIMQVSAGRGPRIRCLYQPAPQGIGASCREALQIARMEGCARVHGDYAFGREWACGFCKG